MADIEKSIKFNEAQATLIESKLMDSQFSHKNWADDELQDIRSTIRNFYRKEQKGRCSYCRNTVSLSSASNCQVEHIAPKAAHRSFIFEPRNLCVICADCNDIKKAQETCDMVIDTMNKSNSRKQYPRSSNAFKIVHPHFDNYDEHILILPSGLYIDRSKKGHFTIGACKLNRRLYSFGWEKEIIDDDKLTEIMEKWISEKNVDKRKALLKQFKLLVLES